MANRFAVGTGNWDASNTGIWSATSGGATGASVPTVADEVFFNASTGNITLTAVGNCRAIDCTGYTGTFTHNAAITLNIGDATAGTGNNALKFVAGMTYTPLAINSLLNFATTVTATPQTITSGGKNFANTLFGNAAAGSWKLLDASNITASSATLTLTRGTLDTNSQTCSWGGFSSANSNTRTLTLGSSAITTTAGTGWNTSTATNLTITANTAVVTMTASSSLFTTATKNFNGMSVVMNGAGASAEIRTGVPTFANFTRTGTAVKTDGLFFGTTSGMVVTGTLTLTGNSTTNRLIIYSGTVGSSRTITAAAISITNVDFQDITGAGAASPFTGTSLGDALGNSGITFDTPVTQTRTGAGGNWSTAANWTSRVPLPQDDVIVSSGASGTISGDMPRGGKSVDYTGFTGTLSHTVSVTFYGSFTLSVGMTVANSNAVLAGRGAYTITTAGKTLNLPLSINAPGGTYTLQDSLTSTVAFSVTNGSLNANNFNVTCAFFSVLSTGGSTLTMGSGTWTMTQGTGAVWNIPASTTVSGSSSTIIFSTASISTRSFGGGGKIYGTLTYTVANSPGSLTITGDNTFNTITIGSGRILTMPASTVNTINSGGSFNVSGVNNGYLYIPGVAANYANTPDSAALSITGNIDIRCRVAFDNWLPAVSLEMVNKYSTAGSNKSYRLFIDSAGRPQITISSDGISTSGIVSSGTALGFAAGSLNWVRFTWRASDGQVKFYTASGALSNPVTADWTQQGSTGTANIGAIADTAIDLEIGSISSGTGVNSSGGKFYRAQIRNNILDDGTGIVFDADFTTKPFGVNSFIESSTNAALVTINGTLAQAGDGRVSLVSSTPGTPATISKPSGTTSVDYLSIQDSAATGGATWFAGANSVNVSGNSGWFFRVPFAGGSFFHVM